ncbi:Bcr/CflA family efflux MFS transporter [Clostridium aminobutyricum]|uniref:Bcr/CflA family efflux transporter n=1 Tax=Clostridium aminobutyricum TaxID=33953 RepID=A0A939IGN3_CLOAM|nr:Bcr/CflA family efflux MFS transporter [Clostridium aminobutyricum]MBN7773590.1 Bcr/CflA family efflux MFS transporter [Clostridium aminobutyricum]
MYEVNNKISQTAERQIYLGRKGLISFIALMNMFIPLSTDMYLPALPYMNTYFGCSSAITNLTLSTFFIFYAMGILFWGPLSDKYGRKSILLTGSIIYMICSVACALSFNIYFLILARIFQGIGAGGITSVSIAVIKDSFSGKKRETILAVCQSISGLAPMLAPVVGAFMLKFSDWRGTFWALAVISAINLLLAILFQETLKNEDRYNGTLFGALGLLVVVAKNKSFILPAVIFSLSALPFMGYIAVSAYIYVDYFDLSAQAYSYYFAANALISIFGPFIYLKFLSNMDKRRFASLIFGLSILSGILVMTVGTLTPIFFWLSFVLMSLAGTIIRPFSTNVLFDQQKSDTGSASSLINTLFTVLGSIGMLIASMPWGNIVTGLGILITIFSVLPLLGWILFLNSKVPCVGLKDNL